MEFWVRRGRLARGTAAEIPRKHENSPTIEKAIEGLSQAALPGIGGLWAPKLDLTRSHWCGLRLLPGLYLGEANYMFLTSLTFARISNRRQLDFASHLE